MDTPRPPTRLRTTLFGLALSLAFVNACAQPRGPELRIRLAHGTKLERETAALLARLLRDHAGALEGRLLTRDVLIDERAIPHSHPVLTLHARHRRQPDLLLATLLHEQLHWFVIRKKPALERALAELARRYPDLPTGFADGAHNRRSSLLHLIVNYLEIHETERLLGKQRAAAVLDFWTTDHYRVLYRIVRRDRASIGALLARLDLVPR